MPFERLHVGKVVLVCWVGEPTPFEVEDVLNDLVRHGREMGGPPAFVSTNVGTNGIPPEDVRAAFVENFPRLLRSVSEVHLVPGGPALLRAIIRSALPPLLLVAGARGRIFVHDDLAVALEVLEKRGQLGAAAARAVMTGAWRSLLDVSSRAGL